MIRNVFSPRLAPLCAGLALPVAAFADVLNKIPFPHPAVTEVLYDVPENADANQDGQRNPVGDEFVEIINPHDKPINLQGYFLADKRGAADTTGGAGIRFKFPSCVLQPGEIALVFNGYLAHIPGVVGTREQAPARKNETFGGAWVFTMANTSANRAFGNNADSCILVSPDGKPIEIISWGPTELAPIEGAVRMLHVGSAAGCSIQALSADDPLVPHKEIDGRPMSPGRTPKKTESTLPGKPSSAAPAPGEGATKTPPAPKRR